MLEQLQKQDSSLSKCYRNTLLFYYFSISVQKCPQKAQYRLLARKINKTSTAGISQISSLSSLQGQTPCGSETSSAVWSEDNSEINLTSSDAVSESAQAKEQPSFFPCKFTFLDCQYQMVLLLVLLGKTYVKDTAQLHQWISLQACGTLYKSLCALPSSRLV